MNPLFGISFFIGFGTFSAYNATWALTGDPAAGVPVATVYFCTMMVFYLVTKKDSKPERYRVTATFPERYQ